MRWLALALIALCLAACGDAPENRLATPVSIEGDTIPAPLEDKTGEAERGRSVFISRDAGHCVLCHAVGGLGVPFQGDVGPALTQIGARLSPAQLRLRIADAQRIWPETVMPSYYRIEGLNQVGRLHAGKPALTAQQIEDLVAYLSGLKG
jgi:sulfur-oxidizing protein SoxX